MKSSNLWGIIWKVGIYAILATILYLVILYKVKWEHKDLNTYLYFYDCNKALCTSTINQDDYYNKVKCDNDICPYISEIINDNIVILNNSNKSWVYNYIGDIIINDKYIDYRCLDNDIIIVKDENQMEGVIDLKGDELVIPQYDNIDYYNNGFITYKQNNMYGIDTTNKTYQIEAKFEDIVLINNSIFAGRLDNYYQIYSYNDNNTINTNQYNFVYTYNDIILVINNKKIDILTTELNSTMLMKIDTFYEYTTEKERESLDLYHDSEYIYFKVFVNENEYKLYKYNIQDKKLV